MRAVCRGCMNRCSLEEGQTGMCRARKNTGGAVIPVNYGKITSMALDPIEKKPLRRFLPGSVILSVGSFGCNLRCPFCQNHEISHEGRGIEVTDERLAEIFLEQQARGAATLDLVTPTHYVPEILHALHMAREQGFHLPVVYNSGAYETEETIEALRGAVDIFLPDLKYADEASAREYSLAPDYFAVATKAITRMYEEVGPLQFAPDGQLKRGVIIRHLVLPGHRHESMRVLDWIHETFGDTVQISLMNQYTPMYRAAEHKGMNRRLTTFEYQSVVDHALKLGITHCYVQQGRTADTKFVPHFDGSGVEQG